MPRPGSHGGTLAYATACALACTAACGVQLGGTGDDTARDDARPADAPVDARPCTGGDARMRSPSGACLFVVLAPATFTDAQAGCAARGGRLATLRNAQDDATARLLVRAGMLDAFDAFIGLSDLAVEGTFVWIVDGAPLGPETYSNWYPSEPNDGGGGYPEDCGVANGRRDGKWDDRPCEPMPNVGGGMYSYLCES